jgi:hypothetical protein
MIQTLKSRATYDAILSVAEGKRKNTSTEMAKNNFTWKQYM